MAVAMLSLVVMVLCVLGVRGDCEPEVIKKIYAIWDGNPPHNILSQQVGNQTYLYLPPIFDQEIRDGLKCFKTELDPDKGSTIDYHIFKDPKKNIEIAYEMVEEKKGVVTNINGDYEDQMYYVYFKLKVGLVYQCGDGYDPFVYISVVNYDIKNIKQMISVQEASIVAISKLDKRFGKNLNPSDCPGD